MDDELGLGYSFSLPKSEMQKSLADIISGNMTTLNTDMASSLSDDIANATKSVLTTPPQVGEEGFFDNIFSDKYKMGNIAGLAGALTQLAAAPTMLKQAKLQNKSLQFNLDTARDEQAKRSKNIAGFNAFRG